MAFIYQLFQHTPADHLSNIGLILLILKSIIAGVGVIVIFIGALLSAYRFFKFKFFPDMQEEKHALKIDIIRRNLGLTIILGLEFIIAADVVQTTTIPDYYSLGILAITVLIRTFLSYTLNREISKFSNLK